MKATKLLQLGQSLGPLGGLHIDIPEGAVFHAATCSLLLYRSRMSSCQTTYDVSVQLQLRDSPRRPPPWCCCWRSKIQHRGLVPLPEMQDLLSTWNGTKQDFKRIRLITGIKTLHFLPPTPPPPRAWSRIMSGPGYRMMSQVSNRLVN